MVVRGPSVRSIRKTAICEVVDYPFVRILSGPHEHEANYPTVNDSHVGIKTNELLFERVGTATIIED